MTSTHNSNGTNPLHRDRQSEQGTHDDPLRIIDTASEPSRPTDVQRGPGQLHPGAQHCLLCQAETVGACLLCHRPLCEQCGASSDDFLRCPMHHQNEVEALRSTLRQAVLAVISTKGYVDDLVALHNRVLSSVSAALLRPYVEHSRK